MSPSTPARREVDVLVLSASLRAGSLNARLAALAARVAAGRGARVRTAHIRDLPLPPLDVDLLEHAGLPDSARAFGDLLAATDGFVIVAPEYNYSVSGVLKNLIDWTSRIKPWPFIGRHGLLMSASPGPVGGVRGLWALRVPLEGLGAHVYPDMFALAHADTAFTADGDLADAALRERLAANVEGFLRITEAARHYPVRGATPAGTASASAVPAGIAPDGAGIPDTGIENAAGPGGAGTTDPGAAGTAGAVRAGATG